MDNTKTKAPRKTVAEFKHGRILVEVHDDDSISIGRLYKPGADAQWGRSSLFYKKDLELMQSPVMEALQWVEDLERERGRKAADVANLEAELGLPAQVL